MGGGGASLEFGEDGAEGFGWAREGHKGAERGIANSAA